MYIVLFIVLAGKRKNMVQLKKLRKSLKSPLTKTSDKGVKKRWLGHALFDLCGDLNLTLVLRAWSTEMFLVKLTSLVKLHLFVQCLQAIWLTLVIKSLKTVLWCVLEEAEAAIRSDSLHWLWLCLVCIKKSQSHVKCSMFCANLSNPFKLLLWNVDIMAFWPIKEVAGQYLWLTL